MDILKTFELFLAAPASIIKKRKIKIMHVETNIFAQKLPVDLKIDFDELRLTVFNNNNVYKLLSNVIRKKQQKEQNENNESTIYYERAVS